MLNIPNNSEHKELTPMQKKVVSWFNEILNIVRTTLGIEWIVSSLERGIIMPNGESIYRDYFEETHSKMKEKLWAFYSFSVTKINLSNGNNIVFYANLEPDLLGKGILFLDAVKENLHPNLRTTLDNKMREIHYIEREIFEKRNSILSATGKKIVETIS